MTDNQFYAKEWLNRMYNLALRIESLEAKRETILASLSGVGKYEIDSFPGSSGDNPTETKNIEFSILSQKIDEESNRLAEEDIRTQEVIDCLGDSKDERLMKAILTYRYSLRWGWKAIAEQIHYSESRTRDYHLLALEAIYKFIPKECIYEN